MKLRMQI